MSKIEKLNKIRKLLICLIILALIATGFIIGLTILFQNKKPKMYTSAYTAREFFQYPCLQKGRVCSQEDIRKAIKVKIPVNEKDTYDFYLLSNDEEKATFIMADNILELTDWSSILNNQKGPADALANLAEITKDWSNIPAIENYEYLDFGRLFAEEQCSPGKEQNKDFPYECLEEEQLARGYKRIFIKDGIEQIEFNLQDSLKENPDDFSGTIISDQEMKARLLTYDEVIQYDYDDSAPDWLIDHLREKEGYWTASSSTFPTSNYTMGAFAIVNYKGKPSIREVYTVANSNDDFKKIGIRPVIEIQK